MDDYHFGESFETDSFGVIIGYWELLFALMKAAGDIEGRRNNQVMERLQDRMKSGD